MRKVKKAIAGAVSTAATAAALALKDGAFSVAELWQCLGATVAGFLIVYGAPRNADAPARSQRGYGAIELLVVVIVIVVLVLFLFWLIPGRHH